jgi:hypothetical protein
VQPLFTKFDPRAFIENEKWQVPPAKAAKPAKAEGQRDATLATLAALAAPSTASQNSTARPEPTPAPGNVWSDTEEECAAILEHEGGAPRAWAEAMARLNPTSVPPNMTSERWEQFIDDCGRFLDGDWAAQAAALGWGPLDLFGCDRERPLADDDHAGLLWRVEGGKLVVMSAYAAIIETATGQQKTFHRRNNRPGELALAWELEEQDRPCPRTIRACR